MTEQTDTSDPKQVKAAIKDAKQRDLLSKIGLRNMMQSEEGRAWLFKFLSTTNAFTNAFSTDPLVMSFRCGEINIGLQLIADMNEVSPELYLLTLKENQNG